MSGTGSPRHRVAAVRRGRGGHDDRGGGAPEARRAGHRRGWGARSSSDRVRRARGAGTHNETLPAPSTARNCTSVCPLGRDDRRRPRTCRLTTSSRRRSTCAYLVVVHAVGCRRVGRAGSGHVTEATFCQLSEPPARRRLVGAVRSMRTVAPSLETRPTLSTARKRTSVPPRLTVRAAPDGKRRPGRAAVRRLLVRSRPRRSRCRTTPPR